MYIWPLVAWHKHWLDKSDYYYEECYDGMRVYYKKRVLIKTDELEEAAVVQKDERWLASRKEVARYIQRNYGSAARLKSAEKLRELENTSRDTPIRQGLRAKELTDLNSYHKRHTYYTLRPPPDL